MLYPPELRAHLYTRVYRYQVWRNSSLARLGLRVPKHFVDLRVRILAPSCSRQAETRLTDAESLRQPPDRTRVRLPSTMDEYIKRLATNMWALESTSASGRLTAC